MCETLDQTTFVYSMTTSYLSSTTVHWRRVKDVVGTCSTTVSTSVILRSVRTIDKAIRQHVNVKSTSAW